MESTRLYIVVLLWAFVMPVYKSVTMNRCLTLLLRNVPSTMVFLLSSCDPPEMTIH